MTAAHGNESDANLRPPLAGNLLKTEKSFFFVLFV